MVAWQIVSIMRISLVNVSKHFLDHTGHLFVFRKSTKLDDLLDLEILGSYMRIFKN
jgi:hypothetical protein